MNINNFVEGAVFSLLCLKVIFMLHTGNSVNECDINVNTRKGESSHDVVKY